VPWIESSEIAELLCCQKKFCIAIEEDIEGMIE
jgi:hypothetical protein